MDLFSAGMNKHAPLADRMRPRTLDEFVGQQHIVGKGKLLRRAIETDSLQSSIFFGPPGCGKTTLASIVANTTGSDFVKLNAVTSGVKDVREVIAAAEDNLKLYGRETYLLLDECHRWSKAQSDSILPALERGIIKFIGSTTENPMVSMTGAIVSRCRAFQFYPLTEEDVKKCVKAAVADKERGMGNYNAEVDEGAYDHIARIANGDVRTALNAIELAILTTEADGNGVIHVTEDIAAESIQQKLINCDDQQFYDMLSAFCKSLRGGDSDAAIAWFARLIYAGIDPRIICRRLIAHASEDVGLADPMALCVATSALTAFQNIGLPEGRIPLTEAILYICNCPKSNSVVTTLDAATACAVEHPTARVPSYLMDKNYSRGTEAIDETPYKYPHNYGGWVEQQYLPDEVKNEVFFEPSGNGQDTGCRQKKDK